MKRIVVITCLSLALSACATSAVLPPSTQLTAAKGEYSAETTFNLMGQAYELAEPYLSPVQKTTAKGWIATAKSALNAARSAEAAGDAVGLANQTNAILALYGQIKSLASSVGAPAPAAAATGGTTP